MAEIGFIGLGNMGGPMARNLMKQGHAVAAFDLAKDKLAQAQKDGARVCASAAEAAKAEVVLTMLPAGRQVREG